MMHTTQDTSRQPNGKFSAYWLDQVDSSPMRSHRGVRSITSWIASEVDHEGNVTVSQRDLADANGCRPDTVRGVLRELRKTGFLSITVNSGPDDPRAASTLHLALPASIVDAELEALASAEALESLDVDA